jgi:hypothetical protein
MHCESHAPLRSAAPDLLRLRVFGVVPSLPSSSGSGSMISMLQLVVEVLTDGREYDLHPTAGRLPAPGAKLDGARARLVALAADAQVAGAGDWKVRDHAGAAECPRRRQTELTQWPATMLSVAPGPSCGTTSTIGYGRRVYQPSR